MRVLVRAGTLFADKLAEAAEGAVEVAPDEVADGEAAEELAQLFLGGEFFGVELRAGVLQGVDGAAEIAEVNVEGGGGGDRLDSVCGFAW